MKPSTTQIIGWTSAALFHVVAVAMVSAFAAWLVLDAESLQLYLSAIQGEHFALDWPSTLLHLGLSACTWAMVVILYKFFTLPQTDKPRRVLKRSIGTTATETLIIIVPFLLLTSGLAQLTMLNIAGMLSDLAAYQGARAVMLWAPEEQMNRTSVNSACDMNADNSICTRARTAVAFALAPTAPSNFQLTNSQPNPGAESFKRARGVMVAGFAGGSGSGGYSKGNRAITFNRGQKGSMKNVSFTRAFDVHRFRVRASRKVSNAYMSLDTFQLIRGSRVGVEFTYKYQLVFPWFGAIWGERASSGTYYSPIQRRFTLPAQANMR